MPSPRRPTKRHDARGSDMATGVVPAYDELPRLGETDLRHAWDVWGRSDRIGTLNHVTEDVCLRALALPRRGVRISLTLPLGEPHPPLYGRSSFEHTVHPRNRNMIEDEIHRLDPQASSQWDGLRHIQAREFGFYGGRFGWDSEDVRELGVHQWASRGLVTRAVLADVAEYRAARDDPYDPFRADPVTAEELVDVLATQRIALEAGDLLLVRTGWLAALRTRGIPADARDMPPSCGLHAGAEMAQWLWDSRVAAVAADNPAVEVLPADPTVGSLHRRLIPALGMPLGELWDLEELSQESQESRIYECCMVSVPLHLQGGVASPANAVAIL